MKILNYSALGALVLILLLWVVLLIDAGNSLHYMSETLHLLEAWIKPSAE